ncbi:ABC-2 type transporter [Bombiscardovia coagulans]|uniref:ABC-2 type transporter n=2 Tax=Bombiscardovia coagulans TaxID=686666 RepID=A0A261EQ46_9BIFI|nr:ABC-2 type transporter [Bombiscardovia coagulans]
MISLLIRTLSTANVSRQSSMLFADVKTVLVSVIVTPVLDIIFSVLLGASLASPNLIRIAYAGTIISIAMTTCTAMCTTVSFDKDQGIIQDVLSRRVFDGAYWIGISIPAAFAGLSTGIVSILGILLVDPIHDIQTFHRITALFPSGIAAGILLGVFVAGLGLPLKDSYAALNTITPLIPITAGVVVPLRFYPDWIHPLLNVLPLSTSVEAIQNTNSWYIVLLREVCIGVAFAGVGILASRYATISLRKGTLREMN